ncbi:hypothetical protein ACFL5I_01455 [Planctomycetota bacterium]
MHKIFNKGNIPTFCRDLRVSPTGTSVGRKVPSSLRGSKKGGVANELLSLVKGRKVDALVGAVTGRDLFNLNKQPEENERL